MSEVRQAAAGVHRTRLLAEFIALYLAAPVVMAVLLPPSAMFPALFGVTALGIVLLWLTPGFHWSDLSRNWRRVSWPAVITFAALTFAVCYVVVTWAAPGALFALWRFNPELLLMIMLLYPILSALPQEIVFRPLFFRRYGALIPGPRMAILANAAVFSFAHLMFWNWIVMAMTFAGGIAFAWAYAARGNFPMAWLLHAIGGNIVFLLGLGIFFYSGNVERPF